LISEIDLLELHAAKQVNLNRAELSLGTLGGGNYFIVLDRDDDDRLYFVVHSGNRNLGKQVATYYQKAVILGLADKSKYVELKRQGREPEIQAEIKKLGDRKVDKNLTFAEGRFFDDYLRHSFCFFLQ